MVHARLLSALCAATTVACGVATAATPPPDLSDGDLGVSTLKTCTPRGAAVLKRAGSLRVIRWRGHTYGCMAAARRAFPLRDGFDGDVRFAVRPPYVLRGHWLAWQWRSSAPNLRNTNVSVMNLRTGRWRRDYSIGGATDPIRKLVLASDGVAAAIISAGGGATVLILDTADGTQGRKVDTGVDPSYLRLTKQSVVWRRSDGSQRSTRLRPRTRAGSDTIGAVGSS